MPRVPYRLFRPLRCCPARWSPLVYGGSALRPLCGGASLLTSCKGSICPITWLETHFVQGPMVTHATTILCAHAMPCVLAIWCMLVLLQVSTIPCEVTMLLLPLLVHLNNLKIQCLCTTLVDEIISDSYVEDDSDWIVSHCLEILWCKSQNCPSWYEGSLPSGLMNCPPRGSNLQHLLLVQARSQSLPRWGWCATLTCTCDLGGISQGNKNGVFRCVIPTFLLLR